MNLSNSYFAIANPFLLFDRWIHQYRHQRCVLLQGKKIEVTWTKRADEVLEKRREPLMIEMQLYFSCVVKKRVLFHQRVDFDTVSVDEKLGLGYRAIQSAVCDPETFAQDYPAGRLLDSIAASKMQPSRLNIDFRQGRWQGEMAF